MTKDTAVFAYPKDELPNPGLLPGKMNLFGKLRERGVTPLVSRRAETAFDDSSIEAGVLVAENEVRAVGRTALEQVGVIVNRLDRSIKKDRLAEAVASDLPPLINENELRSLVFRKNRVQDEILADLGLGMPSVLLQSEDDVQKFVEANGEGEYFVKPNSGTFSKGIKRLDAADIHKHVASEESYGKTLLQPAYDFSGAFDASIRPLDARSREDFETFNVNGTTKELRMYGFLGPNGVDVYPVARSMKDADHWLFIDPESLPEKLYTDTKSVFQKAGQLTNSKAIYGALDIGYGARQGEVPDYHVVEFNGRAPYMIGFDKHPEVANTLRDMFADQIASLTEIQ
jgi:hypothetical protein